MTTSKLTRMALSENPRFLTLNTPVRCTDPRKQEKRPESPRGGLIQALWRQWRTYRLVQEKKRLWSSFQRVAEALGLSTDKQQQTASQKAKLDRIRKIEAELRTINYTQTTK